MREKKEKKNWALIVFIVFIMLGTSVSFVFFGFSPAGEKTKYNGFTFTRNRDIWISKINGVDAAFSFLPSEVENVLLSGDSISKLQGKFEIDVTYDTNSTFKESIALAQHQLALTLGAYNIYIRRGFTANSSFNLPVITCDGTNINIPIIYFKQGNATLIHSENNCIMAEASSNLDFLKVKDRIVYGILGVIK